MGAKTWMLVYSDSEPRQTLARRPQLDRDASVQLARRIFNDRRLVQLDDVDLSDTQPRNSDIHVGCFADLAIIACEEFAIDQPSRLPEKWIRGGGSGVVTLHCMHSVVNWCAFAQWRAGTLIRSLSVLPEQGAMENLGTPFGFESPYWSGEHSYLSEEEIEESGITIPFDPLELGEAALHAFFGYHLEGDMSEADFDPVDMPLLRFASKKSFLKRLFG